MAGLTDQTEEILKRARAAVTARPNDEQLHRMLADLYEQLGKHSESAPHLGFLLSTARSPDEMLYVRYAKALYRSGSFFQAASVLDQGLASFPGSASLLHNKALNLWLLGKFPEAAALYADIVARDPSDKRAAGMIGSLKLLMSDMKEGFDEYAARPVNSALAALFQQWPIWSGQPLVGKRLILWSEQGLGDVILFLSLLPWVLAQGAAVSVVVTAKWRRCPDRSPAGRGRAA